MMCGTNVKGERVSLLTRQTRFGEAGKRAVRMDDLGSPLNIIPRIASGVHPGLFFIPAPFLTGQGPEPGLQRPKSRKSIP